MKYQEDGLLNLFTAMVEQCLHDEDTARKMGTTDRSVAEFINGENFEHYLVLMGINEGMVPSYREAFWKRINENNS